MKTATEINESGPRTQDVQQKSELGTSQAESLPSNSREISSSDVSIIKQIVYDTSKKKSERNSRNYETYRDIELLAMLTY